MHSTPNRAAAKRFKLTANGKVKHRKAFRAHILSSKPHKRKRLLRKADYVDSTTFMVTTDQDVTDYDGGMVSRQHQCCGILAVRHANAQAITGLKLWGSNDNPGRLLRARIGDRDLADELFERGSPAQEATRALSPRIEASTRIKVSLDAIQDL